MLFIFGWGRRTVNDKGPTLPLTCPNCGNERYWNLVNAKTWFTLFFIPVIPYNNDNYLLCPVCERGMELNSEQAERAKQLNGSTQAYLNKQITEEQYKQILENTRLLQ
jgi:hypothetical protein